jgi:hypothetical protein
VSGASGVAPPEHVYPTVPAVVQATFASWAHVGVVADVLQQYPIAPLLSAMPAPQVSEAAGMAPPEQVYPVAPAVVQATFASWAHVGTVVVVVVQQKPIALPPPSVTPAPQVSGARGGSPVGHEYPVLPAVMQTTFGSAAHAAVVVGALPVVLQQ